MKRTIARNRRIKSNQAVAIEHPEMPSNLIQSAFEKILATDFSSEPARQSHEAEIRVALDEIAKDLRKIRRETNWLTGAGYITMTHALTMHFRKSDWLHFEDKASELWARSVLSVCAHYHHLVGPAMLAHAECQDRLGHSDQAVLIYSCVVKDFAFIADDWISDEEAPQDSDDHISLGCLQTAVDYLLSHGTTKIDQIDLTSIKINIREIFARSRPKDSEK